MDSKLIAVVGTTLALTIGGEGQAAVPTTSPQESASTDGSRAQVGSGKTKGADRASARVSMSVQDRRSRARTLSHETNAQDLSLSPEQKAYVERLVQQARAKGLASREMWHRLLHYRHGVFGWKSEADGAGFFLAKDGKTDPEAELEADIRGFYAPSFSDPKFQHPYCRFPARLAWISAQLHIDRSKLPSRVCKKFQKFYRELRPKSVTLVFSSYYLNNPASAFGHTFLRIDKYGRSDDDAARALLDYGINYAANVDTNNSLVYAFKGLTGMFPGTFSRVPYYLKVREYNDYESRDLWEYELDLTHEQMSMLVAHLWELGSTYFDYFYLSENCSYHILGALEVVDPKIHLLDKVGWPVIPSDTVKAVMSVPGLVRKIRFRPSNRTQAKYRISQLDSDEREMLDELLDDPEAPFPPGFTKKRQAKVLDTAMDLMGFRLARKHVERKEKEKPSDAALAEQKLLQRRASLQVRSDEMHVPPPLRKQPHLGHGSVRLGLGSGYQDGRGAFHSLRYRLSLHDLADLTEGYPDHAEIQFMAMDARYYLQEPAVSLENFYLAQATSLVPLTEFEKRMSWTFRVGATRLRDPGCEDCLAATTGAGAGITLGAFHDSLMFWALADARVFYPASGGVGDKIRLGAGPSGGLLARFGQAATFLATGYLTYQPWQEQRTTWGASGVLRIHYLKNFAFSMESKLQREGWSAQAISFMYF